jgi:hypothetical protein
LVFPGTVDLKEQETVVVLPGARFALDGQETVTVDGAETLRITGPDRPERLVRLTVPFPEGAVNETGDAEMLKSMSVTERMIEWLSDPLVAEKVTV